MVADAVDPGFESVKAPSGPPRRRGVWIAVGVALVASLAALAWFLVAWGERGAEEASVQDAIDSARDATTAVAATLAPATGVYTYASSGSEALSLLGTGQEWGDTIPATVTAVGDGCWEHRMDYSTNHWASQEFCPEGDRLMERSGVVFQRFDFVAVTVDEETVFRCEPPTATIDLGASPGDSWPSRCDGTSAQRGTTTISAGQNEFIGEETVVVEGEDIAALHYRLDREITGDQQGTNRVESWFHASTGLLLKGTREVEVASPSPIGDIVYTESGTFELTSLSPQH